MDEVWREITGFPSYEVSDLGRVRSWKKPSSFGGWATDRTKPATILAGGASNGYKNVALCDGKGVRKLCIVSRLVLQEFVGPAPEGFEACHGNGIRDDNRLVNLRWGSPKENAQDRNKHGTSRLCIHPGADSGNSKITWDQVASIREQRAAGVPRRVVAEHFGVSEATVSHITKGRRYVQQGVSQ